MTRKRALDERPSKQLLRGKYLAKRNGGDESPLEHTVASLTENNLLSGLLNFVAAYPGFARRLFDTHGHVKGLGTRLGRGEVLVWFIFDDVELGGSSSNHDVVIGGKPVLEIKCARRSGQRYHSFMLGIDEVPASLKYFYRTLKLFERADRAGRVSLPQHFANISKKKLEELRAAYPAAYRRSEERYLDDLLEHGPVGKKSYLIFDYDTGTPIYLGKLKREQLKIDRVSGGLTRLSFKP